MRRFFREGGKEILPYEQYRWLNKWKKRKKEKKKKKRKEQREERNETETISRGGSRRNFAMLGVARAIRLSSSRLYFYHVYFHPSFGILCT